MEESYNLGTQDDYYTPDLLNPDELKKDNKCMH